MQKLASEFADKLLKEGIYVIGFSFSGSFPKGKARLELKYLLLTQKKT